MTIDVVIPNYNGSNLIKKNLPLVLKAIEDYKGASVIILDDRSKDDDFENLKNIVDEENKSSKNKIHLFRHEKNTGFSSAVDDGVKESEADLVVLLNSDVAPSKNFLESVLPHFKEDEELFGVGLMDKSIEGDGYVYRGRGKGEWKRGFVAHSRGEVDQTDTFWISGGSSVVRREIFHKLSGFDPIYNPFYWEDIDLSYRAQKSGYRILFENKSIVEHRHEEGAIKKHYKSSKVITIAYRNQFTFVWKNITDIGMLLSHFIWLPYHILRAIVSLDKAFLVGFLMAVVRIPAIISKRSKQKRLYKLTDKEVIK